MDRVTRCLQCGKRMVPVPSQTGHTELEVRMVCDKLDPMEMTAANKWADSPWLSLFPRQPLERTCPQQALRRDVPVFNVGDRTSARPMSPSAS